MEPVSYSPWLPIEDIPTVMYCEGLHDDYEHFRILLKGPDPDSRTLRLLFDSAVAYRNVNESYKSRTWSELPDKLPPLLVVENSPWLESLRREAGGVLDDVHLCHYLVLTPEDCIDVASEFPPQVEWLNS